MKSTSISEYWRNSGVYVAPLSSRNSPKIRTFDVFACVSRQEAEVVRKWFVSSIISLPSKNVDRADFNCGWDVPALTSLLKRRLYRRFVSVFNTVDEAFSRCCALRGKRSGMVMTEQKEEDGPSTYFHFVSYSFFFSFFVSFLFRTIFNIRKKKNKYFSDIQSGTRIRSNKFWATVKEEKKKKKNWLEFQDV